MTKKLKATLSMFLCAVMVLCSVAVGGMFANADTNTGKAIQLVKDGAAANITGGQVSNIYFGTYEQSKNEDGTYNTDPIKWRVLANNTSSKQLFLLSDQALDTVQYHTEYEDVTWEKSTIHSWLNSTFYNNAFNEEEKAKIINTNVTADVNPKYNTDPGNDTKDKVFLLSINEVKKYFSSAETRKCVPTDYAINKGAYTDSDYTVDGKATCWWWLRSPGINGGRAACVRNDGDVNYFGGRVDHDYDCVRPAFNLNLESVIFTSAAVGGKISSAEGGDAISKIADYSGNDWKVTLKDADREFKVTESNASGKPGETITLSYTGATIYNKDSTPNEYISVIITDSNGDAIYYGRITQPTSTNGKVNITIPSDLANGKYTLNVFSEQYNGGANDDTKLTDYASEFSTIKLTVCDHTGNTNKATCTEPCLCSVCTKELSPATGHTFGEWKVTKSATFFKDGVETHSCINEGCTETETRVVLSKFSEFKSGLFGVDFLKAILTVFADLLTSIC